MKKLILTSFILAGALSLCACSNTSTSSADNSSAQESSSANAASSSSDNISESSSDSSEDVSSESTADNTDNSTAGKKVLVAYYSATGSTKAVAEYIVKATGGDIYEITPAVPYTSEDLNYNKSDSRVCKEHDSADRTVELSNATPDNWSDYDTVFVGYPIWWGEASWVTASFVKANDFDGKTVIPFCTSASSGLGSSASELAGSANGGTWLDGMRFSSSAAESDVTDWVNSLGL